MKRVIPLLIFIAFWGCNQIELIDEDSSSQDAFTTSYVQKDHFSVGSTITIQSFDSDFNSNKQLPNSEIEDYTGKYFINLTGVESGSYLEVIAEGKFET